MLNCPRCEKPTSLCLCTDIQPRKTHTEILILQHPQEPDKLLGTARLAHLNLKNSHLRIGLSWKNLSTALGRSADASKWGVLYLGSGAKNSLPKAPGLYFLTKKGELKPTPAHIEGFIVLDGTWSQAKSLWWRNPWLLKLHRAMLLPESGSLYGRLRKEPHPGCLSTIESVALTLSYLGEPQETKDLLFTQFQSLLKKYHSEKAKKTL